MVPNSLPIIAVSAIASAPQNVRRAASSPNIGTACPRTDRTEKSQENQWGNRHNGNKRIGGCNNNDEQGHRRAYD
jgi:hypothetical protein